MSDAPPEPDPAAAPEGGEGTVATAVPPPPPAYPSPPPPAQIATASGKRPLLIGLVALLLVVVMAIAYAGIGFADAQVRLNKAQTAYNSVVDHQNKLNDAVNALGDKLTASNITNASASDIQQFKTTMNQMVSQSKDAQAQIATDDASLASADDQLNQDRWLTAVRRSDLDRASTRIGHARRALAEAKTITSDYILIGAFYDSFFDMAIDLENLVAKAQSSDFSAVAAANEKLKTDVAGAIQLDRAPGLPPETDALLHDIQTFANDVTKLLNAAASGDQSGVDASISAVEADSSRLQAYDFNKMGSDVDAYYKPLIDAYNSEVDKANNS